MKTINKDQMAIVSGKGWLCGGWAGFVFAVTTLPYAFGIGLAAGCLISDSWMDRQSGINL